MSKATESVDMQPYQLSSAFGDAKGDVSPTPHQSLDEKNNGSTNEASRPSIGETQKAKTKRLRRTKRLVKRKRLRCALSQYWLFEVMCWLVSLLLFAAIIGLLAGFDGHSLPQWHLGITLSTLVSLFSTVATFTMAIPIAAGLGQLKWLWFHGQERPISDYTILEGASSGPFGSFTLILKWTGGLLAVCGAVLTILTIAVNPFVQQVILYESRALNISNASIPIALKYEALGPDASFGGDDIDLPMQAAVTNGLLNLDPVPGFFDVVPECPTGNCTWPPYQSVAVCSLCKDITSDLKTQFGKATDYYGTTGLSYNVSLPNGFFLVAPYSSSTEGLFSMAINDTFGTIAFPDAIANSPLLDFFAIMGPYNQSNTNGLTPNTQVGPYAAECVLQFCVQSYTATSRNNSFIEIQTSAPTVLNLTFLADINTTPDYLVNFLSLRGLSMYLSRRFTGYVQARLLQTPTNLFDSDLTQAIFQAMNSTPHTLDKIMGNVAKSMTLNMRTRDSEGTVVGTAAADVSFIRIEWPWMTLPLALLLAVLIFLIVVSVMTSKKGLEPWKDNSLATLFHGLDHNETRRLRGVDFERVSDMDEAAQRLLVRMEHRREGWGLRSVALEH